jgi:hypothetical protein
MDRVVFFINKLSMWIGHAFAWCILVLRRTRFRGMPMCAGM